MSGLALVLLVHAARVTLVGLVAWVAAALIGRRRPDWACRICLAGLIAMLALAVLGPLPWPRLAWPVAINSALGPSRELMHTVARWRPVDDPERQGTSTERGPRRHPEHRREDGSNDRAEGAMASGPSPFTTVSEISWSWLILGVLAGVAGAGLLRLLAGLNHVRRCVRSAEPVRDPEPLAVVEGFVEHLRIRRPVRLLESDRVTMPATVGLLRPVVLLPTGWRDRSSEHLRAALAHELGHVARLDFPAWVLARICLALHWCHPLARILSTRLQLYQELATDVRAIELVGDARIYVRCLAQLALGTDAPSEPAAANPRPLSSLDGSLLWRLTMLRPFLDPRAQATATDRRALRYAGPFLLGLVVGATVLALCLRPPAQTAMAQDTEPPLAILNEPGDRPFTLDGVPPEAIAGAALRPSQILEFGPLKQLYTLATVGGQGEVPLILGSIGLSPENVQELYAVVFPGSLGIGNDPLMSLAFNSALIVRTRSRVSLDGVAQLTEMPQVQASQRMYASQAYEQVYVGGQFPVSLFRIDDETTVLACGESALYPIMRRALDASSSHPADPIWEDLADGDVAIVFDVGAARAAVERLLLMGGGGDPGGALLVSAATSPFAPLWEQTTWMGVGGGIDRGTMELKMLALVNTDEGVSDVEATTAAFATLFRNTGTRVPDTYRNLLNSAIGDSQQAQLVSSFNQLLNFVEEIAGNLKVVAEDRVVRIETRAQTRLSEFSYLELVSILGEIF